MKKLLLFVAVLAIITGAVVIALPKIVSIEKIEAQAKEKFKAATGRDLAYGKMRFTLWPNIGLRIHDVAISNPAWAKNKSLLTLGEMDVSLAVAPLLKKQIEVKKFILKKPVIALEKGQDGKTSWAFDIPSGAAAKKSEGGVGAEDFSVTLGEFSISDGVLTFADVAAGKTYQIDDIDISLIMPTLESPLSLDGGFIHNQKRVNIVLGLDRPIELAQGNSSKGSLKVKTEDLIAALDGEFSSSSIMYKGGTEATILSLRRLLAWVGGTPEESLPVSKVTFKSSTELTSDALKLSGASLELDEIKAGGELNVGFAGTRPDIFGRLSVDKINLDKFIKPGEGGSAASSAAPQPSQEGWDDTAIDFSVLKSLNADLILQTQGFSVKGVDVGASNLTIKIKDGNLQFSSSEAELFDGKFQSDLNLNTSSSNPTMSFKFDMTNVQAKPVLTNFANFTKLSGTADADISVTSSGKSQKEIIRALNGSGKVMFRDGALEGIDMVNIAKMIQSKLDNMGVGEGKTDFVELGGTFTIVKGIATNNDLRMRGPLLQVTGGGNIDLPLKSVDYRVTPVLTASSAADSASGISVPVDIKGPFSNIKVKPDYAAVIKNAIQNPEELKKTLKSAEDSIEPAKDNIKALRDDLKQDPAKALEGLIQGGGLDGLLKKKETIPAEPSP